MRPLLLAAAFLALSCGPAAQQLTIGDVLADPGRYKGQTLEVQGEVVDASGQFSIGVYSFDDGTGEISVLTTGGVPAVGSSFTLTGEVMGGVTVGGKSYGVSIRESERGYSEAGRSP